jgi:D-threonate/D-erythronate kinase
VSEVRILADDLTGALDTAAAFAGDVPVYLDAPPAVDAISGPVAVVATATRDVPAGSLPRLLAPSLPWLVDAGLAFKKVDSLLRGNTFVECAHVACAGGFGRVVFAPAFPQQGRVTIDGWQCVVPPGEPLANRQPVGDALPATVFSALGLTVSPPAEPSSDRLSVWIPEVRSEDDLARVAALSTRAEARRWLWCGSAGLAHAIAAIRHLAPSTRRVAPPRGIPGPVLLISASRHPVAQAQWNAVRASRQGAIVTVHGQPAALQAACRAMRTTFDLALLDLAPAEALSPREAASLLTRQLEAIVRAAPRPAALVVVGGDTLRTLCVAAGARGLSAGASSRAGWGCARLIGGVWDGVACHSRSGAFGGPDDLSTMVRFVACPTPDLKEH